ncbi:MAG: sigma-E processing peptidase SpoIIGA [Clostridia bacterium]|nr:sigma-E processing peptidase SpoIIGA [Clostridia bacterium]
MIVYVEYVLIDNLVINHLILLSTATFGKLKNNKPRMFLSALLGTIIALISPILPSYINFAIKPLLAICMILLAFKIENIKKFFVCLMLFFVSTFLYGGACFGICEMLNINFFVTNGPTYQYNFPIGLILLICLILYFCLKNIVKYCLNQHKNSKFLFEIKLVNNNTTCKTTAFLDSGNKISINGKAVSIINFKTFNSLFPNIKIQDVLLKKPLPIKNQAYIKINSISTKDEKILTFCIDSVFIDNKEIKNATLGLSLYNFNKNTNSDVIISSDILEG